jgi:hypothetical protein
MAPRLQTRPDGLDLALSHPDLRDELIGIRTGASVELMLEALKLGANLPQFIHHPNLGGWHDG